MNYLVSIPTETTTKNEKQLKKSGNLFLKGSPEYSEDFTWTLSVRFLGCVSYSFLIAELFHGQTFDP